MSARRGRRCGWAKGSFMEEGVGRLGHKSRGNNVAGGTTHPPNPRAGEGRAETNNGDPPEFPGLQAMTRPLTPVRAPSSSTRIDAQVSGASAALREPYVNGRLGEFDVWMSDRGDSARGAPAALRFKLAGLAGVDASVYAASSRRSRSGSMSGCVSS